LSAAFEFQRLLWHHRVVDKRQSLGIGEPILRHDQRFIWFDFIRGICAIAVCAGHLRAVSIVDYSNLATTTLFQKFFYVATGLGHQSVMVFFVLSGFFVGGAALKNRNGFDILKYATARLTRLWIVLIPALVVTAAIDLALKAYAPDVLSGHYRWLWNSGPSADSSYSASLKTFGANIFFLQTITAPVFGTNGPLWSLSNEFWYYVLFPILLLIFKGHIRNKKLSIYQRLALGVLGLGLALQLPLGILKGFLIWCLGLLIYATQGRTTGKLNGYLLAIGSILFGVALAYSKSEAMQRNLGVSPDFLVGTTFCILAIGIVSRTPSTSSSVWFRNLAKLTSNFSFSLYLIHFPLVALIGGLFYRDVKLQPDFNGLLCFSLWLILLLFCGYFFYLIFERRTDNVRRRIEMIVGVPAQRA
jgi:peptidoglycan/LPS O-acetylase OafA/YrhL